MSDETDRLWRLHELDERAIAARAVLGKFPEQKRSLEHRVAVEKEHLATLAKTVDDVIKARRKIEQEIEAVTAQQRQFESRQPMVKTNDEFRALSHEIEGCKAKRSELETQVLMRLEDEDSEARKKPQFEKALKDAEAERAARLQAIERDEAKANTELQAIEADRAKEREGLPPMTRQRYDRVHASREGRAVVAVIKNACGGCFRAQPPQAMQELRRGDRVLVCDGCGRLLVLPPGQAAA